MIHPIIKTENYLLVVDESEIKVRDWYLRYNSLILKCTKLELKFNEALGKEETIISSNGCGDPYERSKSSLKKIIYHLPINNAPILEGVPLLPPLKISEVAYDECQLVARKENVYNTDGKFMFSVSMTDKAKGLVDNDGWEKGKESWLDYRKRTEAERELEKQKQYKLAADLAEAFNNKAKEKYKYTEEDLRKAFQCGQQWVHEITNTDKDPTNFNELIQSLQQPKYPVAFECEMANTITNSQGIIQVVGNYIYDQITSH